MKKLLLLGSMLFSLNVFAQKTDSMTLKITNDHYTVSGGLLAAANYSRFRPNSTAAIESDKWKWGYAGGIWLNFPVSNAFSVEPQGIY